MTREEFFEWLETCPTHKWEVTHYAYGPRCLTRKEYGHVVVSFPVKAEEEKE